MTMNKLGINPHFCPIIAAFLGQWEAGAKCQALFLRWYYLSFFQMLVSGSNLSNIYNIDSIRIPEKSRLKEKTTLIAPQVFR